ncbi:hypothetical protein UPYG_G00142990 [Umbra pygmaea]|uniref:LIM zinc-binding domain-containing protein n=1 Tax=Umbra pygmaea TaxID=75934 RepID=A0ABD0WVQ4_UMBPY
MQSCARCGFVVYPAEKINCIDQNWHKACFHCDVCKMALTAKNFVSHKKRPYCSVHNPRNNMFTSVYETPINTNAKKQAGVSSEVEYKRGHDERVTQFTSGVDTPLILHAKTGGSIFSDTFPLDWQAKYTEENEQIKGKDNFPATITPGYQNPKKANTLATSVEYKKGHEERLSKYTSIAETTQLILAKSQGQTSRDYAYTEEYEQKRGKGSFPAHLTPGYQVSKKATEMASNVKYRQIYEQEMKGKATSEAGAAEFAFARESAGNFSQIAYTEDYEQQRGKGSFPAMITPAYQQAKKAQDHASDAKNWPTNSG